MTDRDLEVLRFIVDFIGRRGVAPTFDEMREGMSLASKSSIARRLDRLERDGYIRRHPLHRRAIQVLKLPDLAPSTTVREQKLEEALRFAATVLKSRDLWTPTCEAVIGGALVAAVSP